jgi:hypothetical protein
MDNEDENNEEDFGEDAACPQCGMRQYNDVCPNCGIKIKEEEEKIEKKDDDDEYDWREKR